MQPLPSCFLRGRSLGAVTSLFSGSRGGVWREIVSGTVLVYFRKIVLGCADALTVLIGPKGVPTVGTSGSDAWCIAAETDYSSHPLLFTWLSECFRVPQAVSDRISLLCP